MSLWLSFKTTHVKFSNIGSVISKHNTLRLQFNYVMFLNITSPLRRRTAEGLIVSFAAETLLLCHEVEDSDEVGNSDIAVAIHVGISGN